MRICYLARANYTGLQRVARHIASLGNEVHVVTLHPDRVADCEVHAVAGAGRLPGFARFLAALPAVQRRIRQIAPDIIDIHGVTSYGLFAYLSLPCPLVTTVYGTDLYLHAASSWPARVIGRRAVASSAMIFCSTVVVRQYFRSILGVDPGARLRPRSWGVRLDEIEADGEARRVAMRRRLRVSRETRVVLHSRHVAPMWRLTVVVDAVPAVLREHPDTEFWFAYPPPNKEGRAYLAKLQRRVEELGVADRVRWLGQFSYYEIISLMHAADVFVCVGEHDLLPSSLLDAMAAGMVPVLADLPAYREVIEHGSNGFLVAAAEPAALAAQLDFVLRRLSNVRRAAAARNSRLLRERFREEDTAAWLNEQYRRLALAAGGKRQA